MSAEEFGGVWELQVRALNQGWDVTWSQREVEERKWDRKPEREGERENWREGKGRTEGLREGDVSWVQKVNRVPKSSMLSTGRGLQLGQTLQGTHIIPLAHTFFSGQKSRFFFVCLFILVSVHHGSSWPYGKMKPPHLALLSVSLIYVPFFVL